MFPEATSSTSAVHDPVTGLPALAEFRRIVSQALPGAASLSSSPVSHAMPETNAKQRSYVQRIWRGISRNNRYVDQVGIEIGTRGTQDAAGGL